MVGELVDVNRRQRIGNRDGSHICANLASRAFQRLLKRDGPRQRPQQQQRAKSPDQAPALLPMLLDLRSEEHTSELQSLMRISYAVFCLKKKKLSTTYMTRRTQLLN